MSFLISYISFLERLFYFPIYSSTINIVPNLLYFLPGTTFLHHSLSLFFKCRSFLLIFPSGNDFSTFLLPLLLKMSFLFNYISLLERLLLHNSSLYLLFYDFSLLLLPYFFLISSLLLSSFSLFRMLVEYSQPIRMYSCGFNQKSALAADFVKK